MTRFIIRAAIVSFTSMAAPSAEAQVDLRADTALSSVAAVMFAKARCGYQIDRDRLEQAMNFNGLYSGDISPGGRHYTRIRYFFNDLERTFATEAGASCENIKRTFNGPRNAWQGVIIDDR